MASHFDSSEILPYQFEPLGRLQTESSSESDVAESDQEVDDVNINRLGNTDWCSCGQCQTMETGRESVCCQDLASVQSKAQEEDQDCITMHEGFHAVCTNRHSLEVSVFEFARMEGPLDDSQPSHELYRYISYRRFTRWIWHILGAGNRKILPACVVSAIRTAFPSQSYCGFRYARF